MLKAFEIEKYILSYRSTKTDEVSFLLKSTVEKKGKAINYSHRLLYIVMFQNEFLYVGEAKAELKIRFQRGFSSYRHFLRTGKARGGYKGYRWIELMEPGKELTVWVVLFPANYDDKREFVEAIEGEVVLIIRNQTGKWPTYQSEIHFNNKMQNASEIASKIMDKMK